MSSFVRALRPAVVLLFLAAGAAFAATPAEIVKQRQDGMGTMWPNYYKDIAGSIRSSSPDLPMIAAKAAQASEHVKEVAKLFPPGTGRDAVPSTRAKPEIWTQSGDFEAAFKALIDATNILADDAKKGDVEKVKADWTNTAKACGACHGGPKKSGGKFRFEEE